MIVWDKVTKVFTSDLLTKPVTALDNVSFAIREGSMTGYIGANGAGKTTSIKIALNFTRATSGSVIFSSRLGHTKENQLGKIGFLPERPYFYPHLTGKEFSLYMGLLSGMKKSDISHKSTVLAERLGIAHALNRPVVTYSKGMLQRLGFLVAIQHDPHLIILDEPLSGLDPVGRKELKDLMMDLNRSGKTVFFSTHIVSDVEETCSDIVFLRQGKLIYSGGVREIMESAPSRAIRITATLAGEPVLSCPTISREQVFHSWVIKVDASHKELALQELLAKNAKIQSMVPEGASLETIFYGTLK